MRRFSVSNVNNLLFDQRGCFILIACTINMLNVVVKTKMPLVFSMRENRKIHFDSRNKIV